VRLIVGPNTRAVSYRIHGTNGPPKIMLRGPGGRTIASPLHTTGSLQKGRYFLAENPTDGTTDVVIVHPAAGTWTVRAIAGTKSMPTTVDRSNLETPPTIAARITGRGGARTLRVDYAVPRGTSLQLVEHAKGIEHVLASRLHGSRCAGLPRLRPGTDQRILCATVRFQPQPGRGGIRQIQAVVTQRGIPIMSKDVAHFRMPRLTRPSRVTLLRLSRRKGGLLVAFSRSTGAASYDVSVHLGDGRELAYSLGARCQALQIAKVPAGDAAKIKIAGLRFDLVSGTFHSIGIAANTRAAGSASRKFHIKRICR
jgi:hypothetical protein